MSEAVLLVGTKKGLWVAHADESRQDWTWSGPHLPMQGVYGTCVDTRGDQPVLFASGTSEHFGPGVYRSEDLGRSWAEDRGAAVAFPADLGSSIERVWQIQAFHARKAWPG